MKSRDPHPSPLDDPQNAAHAWARYRRMMRWVGLLALAVIAGVWAWLYQDVGFASIHLYIATALGFGLMIMLVGALMGLVFLSSGTGHDESINDPLDDDTWG
ncbi:MAG: hypothetical protein RIS94_1844 [Pseudomonadota bacterium]